MASPSAPEHPRDPFGGAAFLPADDIPAVASLPMDLPSPVPSPRSRSTRSRAVASHTMGLDTATPAAGPQKSVAARRKQRKRRTATTETSAAASTPTPRKRARAAPLKPAPPSPQAEDEDEKKQAATESCCICMCDVEGEDLAGISGCEHMFCFECIEKWAERENSCPLCKNRFTKIDRVNKKKSKGQKNTKRVKQRDQRSDLGPGVALEGLLATFAHRTGRAPNIAHLIFSRSTSTIAFGGPRSFLDDGLMSDSDDESPLSSILSRAFGGGPFLAPIIRPVHLREHLASTSRSYASNSNDRTAGNRPENPLVLDDDSDDDDVVEIVDRPNNQG